MGLGFSVEALGKLVVGEENKHIVTEGLVIASLYIGGRYLLSSITRGGGGESTGSEISSIS